ncbi:MAG: VTT domain-containing protein [Cytophagales bacterium]|nr:VTT domain-containing protein [Cytophagales bacterium]
MEIFKMIFNADVFLNEMVTNYGDLVYFFLFLIIFSETGLVFLPFLPGDGLLFASGVLAVSSSLNPWTLIFVMVIAAFIGSITNFHIGKYLGDGILKTKLIKQKHLKKSKTFFELHGKNAIILCRFMPYIRSIVPFFAGVSKMKIGDYLKYSFSGAIIWVVLFVLLGYYLGQYTFIQSHFQYIVYAMMVFSWIPLIISTYKFLIYQTSTAKTI